MVEWRNAEYLKKWDFYISTHISYICIGIKQGFLLRQMQVSPAAQI